MNSAKRKKAPTAPLDQVSRWFHCFICGTVDHSPDKEPPYRCTACVAPVAANERDGDL